MVNASFRVSDLSSGQWNDAVLSTMLEVLYQDRWIVAINKPTGLLVHRSWMDTDATEFAVQLLRDQLGAWVQPVHRLDRPTSGVLLFALDAEIARRLMEAFAEHSPEKHYLAVVRGWLTGEGCVDSPLRREVDAYTQACTAVEQEAYTRWKSLGTVEFQKPVGRYETARFSLLRLHPVTGRKHQLRRHLAHLRHPIIGDTRHGDGVQNRFFREQFEVNRLLLHAASLRFEHPVTGNEVWIQAKPDPAFSRTLSEFSETI
ncbi:MAG: pseudouridine synthase [Puniceicoccaceae bacterium]